MVLSNRTLSYSKFILFRRSRTSLWRASCAGSPPSEATATPRSSSTTPSRWDPTSTPSWTRWSQNLLLSEKHKLPTNQVRSSYNSYRLFGYDILLDSRRRPHLIEINAAPACYAAKLDSFVNRPMVSFYLYLWSIDWWWAFIFILEIFFS